MVGVGAKLATSWRQRSRIVIGLMAALALIAAAACYHYGWRLWTRAQLQHAQDALVRHDFPAALVHLQTCLRRVPDCAEAHLLAARVNRRLEQPLQAAQHLDDCERLQGGPTQAIRVERALLRVYRGDWTADERFLRTCVEQNDPDAVEILDILSAALILSFRIGEAQDCLDDLLRRQPNHFHALARRGWTARSMSRYAEAVQFFERALTLRPDVDAVRLPLAEIQVALGRFAEAQEHFESLQSRQPNNPSVRFGLARCLAGRGAKDQAVKLLDKLLLESPNDWQALSERGEWSLQLDRPADAEPYLRRAESLAPPDLPLLTRLADCLRLLGKNDEAVSYRRKADRLKADHQRAQQLGDLIRDKSPKDPALRHELGCILLRLQKPEEALHWFQTALAHDPAHRPTHESLAAIYDQQGDSARAAQHRRYLQDRRSASEGGTMK